MRSTLASIRSSDRLIPRILRRNTTIMTVTLSQSVTWTGTVTCQNQVELS